MEAHDKVRTSAPCVFGSPHGYLVYISPQRFTVPLFSLDKKPELVFFFFRAGCKQRIIAWARLPCWSQKMGIAREHPS